MAHNWTKFWTKPVLHLIVEEPTPLIQRSVIVSSFRSGSMSTFAFCELVQERETKRRDARPPRETLVIRRPFTGRGVSSHTHNEAKAQSAGVLNSSRKLPSAFPRLAVLPSRNSRSILSISCASGFARRQTVPQSRHRRRRPQAGSPASSHLGHARAVHPVLCSSCLRIRIMLTVAQPRVPMTACRVGPSQGRPKTGSIDFSDSPQPTQSHQRLTQSANRNTAENNNAEQPQQTTAKANAMKEKTKPLDASDLLIDSTTVFEISLPYVIAQIRQAAEREADRPRGPPSFDGGFAHSCPYRVRIITEAPCPVLAVAFESRPHATLAAACL